VILATETNTLFNWIKSEKRWKKTVLDNTFFAQRYTGSTMSSWGRADTDWLELQIPDRPGFVSEVEWNNLADYDGDVWTLQRGDLVVKGTTNFTDVDRIMRKCVCFKINRIEYRTNTRFRASHWMASGKG
jgi:hypothetical protein